MDGLIYFGDFGDDFGDDFGGASQLTAATPPESVGHFVIWEGGSRTDAVVFLGENMTVAADGDLHGNLTALSAEDANTLTALVNAKLPDGVTIDSFTPNNRVYSDLKLPSGFIAPYEP